MDFLKNTILCGNYTGAQPPPLFKIWDEDNQKLRNDWHMDKMRSWESTRMENLMNKWVELNGMTDDERCANCLTDKIWFMLRYWQNNLTRAHHVYWFDQFNIALNMNMTMWQCIFKVSPNQIAVSQSDGTPKSTI